MTLHDDGLVERLRNATGPSAVLDAELYATIGGAPHTTTAGARKVPLVLKGDPTDWPAYTASVDAALALVERVLPGWTVARLAQQDDKTWFCELREGFLTSYNRVAMSETAYGKQRPSTLPLAILQALLSALSKKDGEK